MDIITNEAEDGRAKEATELRATQLLTEARARRLAALKSAEGLWKDRTDPPKDGVQVQEQLRAEWR